MAIDSLYGAVLKLLYPFEFYTTMLNIYTEKGNLDKIASIIAEMKAYRGITMKLGRFGDDNREWRIDKKNNTISQSITGVKFINDTVAEALSKIDSFAEVDLGDGVPVKLNTFSNVLRHLQMNTSVNARHIDVLIRLNYFEKFGSPEKLLDIFAKFSDGPMKITKTLKSWAKRLEQLNAYELMCIDNPLDIHSLCRAENEFLGLCVSYDTALKEKEYLVTSVDDKYGIKVNLYNLKFGTSGTVKIAKNVYKNKELKAGDVVKMKEVENRERKKFADGKSIKTGLFDVWLKEYDVIDYNM